MSAEVLTGATVRTMDDAHPVVEAVALDSGRIVATGTLERVRAFAGDGATVTDLGGGALLPGFIDAHHHLAYAALDYGSPDLRLPPGSAMADLLERIRDAAARKRDDWVYLSGYEPTEVRERRAPTAAELEECCPGRPLFVQAANGHEGVLNESGLAALGWERAPDPPKGRIVRSRGRPTGELVEAAAFMADAEFRDRVIESGPDRWLADVAAHSRDLMALGITRVGDAAVAPVVEELYARAAAEGALPIAVHPMPVASASVLEPRFDGTPTGEGPERARVGAAKLFVDGGHRCAMCFSAREAAWMATALVRNAIGGAGMAPFRTASRTGRARLGRDRHFHAGMRFWHGDALRTAVAHGAERGFQIAQHAIGNEAIELALTAIERNERKLADAPGRPRLEHVIFPRREHMRRIADAGAIAVVQPALLAEQGDEMLLAPMPRGILTLPLRAMADAGVTLAGSSDYPVTRPDVMRAIQAAVTRRTAGGGRVTAEEAVDVETMLRAYTIGSAQALGVEDEAGTLAAGKQADLVHLAEDPLAVDAERVGDVGVRATWVAGVRR